MEILTFFIMEILSFNHSDDQKVLAFDQAPVTCSITKLQSKNQTYKVKTNHHGSFTGYPALILKPSVVTTHCKTVRLTLILYGVMNRFGIFGLRGRIKTKLAISKNLV